MKDNRLRLLWLIVLPLAVGLTLFSVISPLTAQAQAQPHHQTLYKDVDHLEHLENNAYFLELASEACLARAVDSKLIGMCQAIHIDQVLQIQNDRWTIRSITGIWPINPTLSTDDQTKIEQLLFGTYANPEAFAVDVINTMLDKYNDSDAVSSLCANRGFYAQARWFCRTLNTVDAGQANAIEDYLTFMYGNAKLLHPFHHTSKP
jgi:hypothetical protein